MNARLVKVHESNFLLDTFDVSNCQLEKFYLGQLVDLETCLSLLYSDLGEDGKTGNVIIGKAPFIR